MGAEVGKEKFERGNSMKTDYKTITVALKDGVAVFAMNNPPVNQLSDHFYQGHDGGPGQRLHCTV